MSTAFKAVVGTIVGLALVVGITVGGYHLNWWLAEDKVNRTAEINQNSYGRQNALVEAILQEAKDASDPNIPSAQRKAIITELCFNAAKLTGAIELPFNVQNLIYQECQ